MGTLALEQVGHSWDERRTWAIRDVTLRVEAGELLVLVGSSGCGKSTTLRTINRLVDPLEGRVTIDGRAVGDLDPVRLRRSIGTVFQHIALFPHLTVAENIGLVPRLEGWPRARIEARVSELAKLMGLPAGTWTRLPHQLSGGQQQRVGLARALAAEPRILLMDEPFGALDPVTRDRLQTEVRAIHDALELTTVLVTHDMTEALLMADRIAVLGAGRILQQGSPAELLHAPAHPIVAALMEAPRRHAAVVDSLARP